MGPTDMVLPRGAYYFVLFSSLDCPFAPRPGSSSDQLRNYPDGPGKTLFQTSPVVLSPPPALQWLLKCHCILANQEVDVKLRKLLLCKVHKYRTTTHLYMLGWCLRGKKEGFHGCLKSPNNSMLQGVFSHWLQGSRKKLLDCLVIPQQRVLHGEISLLWHLCWRGGGRAALHLPRHLVLLTHCVHTAVHGGIIDMRTSIY